MTQEERDIIYKDACCRLPYHPYAVYTLDDGTTVQAQLTGADDGQYYGYILDTWGHIPDYDVKLYLRPMSSITEEEKEIYRCLSVTRSEEDLVIPSPLAMQWLLSKHFDINGLIKRGLAIEAHKGMYK